MAPIFWPEATSQTSICLFFAFLANFLSGSRTLSLTLSSLSRSLTPLSRLQIKDLRRKDVDAVDFNDPLVEEKSLFGFQEVEKSSKTKCSNFLSGVKLKKLFDFFVSSLFILSSNAAWTHRNEVRTSLRFGLVPVLVSANSMCLVCFGPIPFGGDSAN